MTSHVRRPPSPPGLPLVGNFLAWLRDPFGVPERWAREHGDIVAMHAFGSTTLMLFAPDPVGELLVKNEASTRKSPLTRGMSCITGDSVVTITGEPWKRRRRLLDPAFRTAQLARYARIVRRHAERYADRWLAAPPCDIHAETLEFMFDSLVDVLTDAPLGAEDRAILRRGFEVFWADFSSREFVALSQMTNGEPYRRLVTPRRWRQKRLLAEFDRIIGDLVRRAREAPGEDLLSALLPSVDRDGGLARHELHEDVITVILAAQETTAMGLTMALDLLARHPDVWARVQAEVDTITGDLDDLAALPYTDAVTREALRLYPPLWGVAREAIAPFSLSGYSVVPGMLLVAAAWVIQRDPRWWGADALTFRPERWLEHNPSTRPRFAWFPFGAGPHLCIGMRFAMMEMVFALATWARRLRFHAESAPPALTTAVTVRPRHPMSLRITARTI
ncbi:cytochrome P450 [Nannocystis sp. SCPEA4]|uniref:cytochrome P450 n=1 Tax=Nannocystis sp. SCPEA4 TaxID=2996787 RepID=UPI00227151AB|nr:cytochrome P450 [Nannocystis sp. SCPEA4]MCY1057566.1 cytochrome P450 [Nannocystis sp. SCPEA4]